MVARPLSPGSGIARTRRLLAAAIGRLGTSAFMPLAVPKVRFTARRIFEAGDARYASERSPANTGLGRPLSGIRWTARPAHRNSLGAGMGPISWVALAAFVLIVAALLIRGLGGPWSSINPQDHPDEDHSDGWPGV